MTRKPLFSILIPARGRPQYLGEAIESVLRQDFHDMELVISNNGADASLREVVERFVGDVRVRYVQHLDVLNMPEHWEKMSRELVGEYVLVLTDRSVLKNGALNYLQYLILQSEKSPDVISWPWDLYYDHYKILLPYPATEKRMQMLNADLLLKSIANGQKNYPYSLPRGLNSCVRNSLIKTIRERFGTVFRPLSPDFTFGYLCLLNTNSLGYVDSPLFVSQGVAVSNGGNGYSGDAEPYMNSLNLHEPFAYVPVKIALVQNTIHEDFLAMASLCSRQDLLEAWSRQSYYLECFEEIDAKRGAAILNTDQINIMSKAVSYALAKEGIEVKQALARTRSPLKKARNLVIAGIKKMLGSNLELIRRIALVRKGGVVYETVFEAAGFASVEKK